MNLMDELSGWLRQIIAVVLLASIIDLMLPNRTMQRYVRLVAGLFVLTVVAMPVLNWVKGDFNGKLAAGLEAVEWGPGGSAAQLAAIEREGSRLRDKHYAQAVSLMSDKLAAEVKSLVEQSENIAVDRVEIVPRQEKDGTLSVALLTVLLAPPTADRQSAGRTAEAASAPIAVIEPIRPIEGLAIDIGADGNGFGNEANAQTNGDADAQTDRDTNAQTDRDADAQTDRTAERTASEAVAVGATAATEVDRATAERIRRLIAGRLGLADGEIRIGRLAVPGAEY